MLIKNSPTDLAYLAGFWDGEGCISMALMSKRYCYLRCVLANTDIEIMLEIHRVFGGCIQRRNCRPSGKPFLELSWHANGAEELLRSILPYLRVKRRQAELALKFVAFRQSPKSERKIAGRRNQLRPEVVARELEFVTAMQSLNGNKGNHARGVQKLAVI